MTDEKEYLLYQAGVGGVGSWLVPHICKLLTEVHAHYDIKVTYTLFDDDIIEQSNIKRQNFIFQDIDKYKAECLAKRYAKSYKGVTYKNDKLI